MCLVQTILLSRTQSPFGSLSQGPIACKGLLAATLEFPNCFSSCEHGSKCLRVKVYLQQHWSSQTVLALASMDLSVCGVGLCQICVDLKKVRGFVSAP